MSAHGHAHGTVDPSVLRSRAGLRAVLLSLAVLGATAGAQAAVYVASGSVALLADLVHNAGDALTALPLGAAFLLASARAERWAGYAVVLAIAVSAAVALYETIVRLIEPRPLDHLWALAGAGLVGWAGNEAAARIRLRAGRRLGSAALVADGNHARVDALVSLGVVASAAAVGLGLELADPLIGLAIVVVILHVLWGSWQTVADGGERHAHGHVLPWARRYDLRMRLRTRGREHAFREEQLDLARVAPGESVLDVGCGTGSLALAAMRRVGPSGLVRGIDPSPQMVARARKKARRAGLEGGFVEGLAQELPFADASFDVVVAVLVLHHLPPDERGRCLAEARRVLRPDGRLLVVDLGGDGHGHGPHAHGHFELDGLLPLLEEAGFDPVERGPVAFRLRRFEGLRYVVASSTTARSSGTRASTVST